MSETLVTEFLCDKIVVFRNSIDATDPAQKQRADAQKAP